ncbi:MAG: PD-(D/E)XK nuclease family protein [Acutalibacteraceae bacterium]
MPENNFEKVCEELRECRRKQIKPQSIPDLFGIQYKEIYITRWLGCLFDPNKNKLGKLSIMPLNALLRADCDGTDNYDEISGETNIEDIKVYTEYVFDSKRRIDIFIETPECFIGIENKICSEEQKDQTKDYADIIEKMAEQSNKKKFCIYLYPEWNNRSNPDGRFRCVTYKGLYKELKKIPLKEKISLNDSENSEDRSQWLLNEFIKYVEVNLMKTYPDFTESAKMYYKNLPVILPAQEEYNQFVENVEEWLLKNLPEGFSSFNRKFNAAWWAIIKDDQWKKLFFHYEIFWPNVSRIALANELLIVIHLETNDKNIKNFFEQESGENWKKVKFDQNKTYTLCSVTVDCNFENEDKARESLNAIQDTLNSEEFDYWTKIAEKYLTTMSS